LKYRIGIRPGQLGWILQNYWLLKEGQMPLSEEMVCGSNHTGRAPYEMAITWVADCDTGIDMLSKCRGIWLEKAKCINQDSEPSMKGLNFRQRAVIGFYLYGIPDEQQTAERALSLMSKLLNGGKLKVRGSNG
jgi:hypothetical protein